MSVRQITYEIQAADKPGGKDRLDDVVEYQEAGSNKIKSVRGRNVEAKDHDSSGWDWRGKGIIKVASSHWDILGWGVDNYTRTQGASSERCLWMVTYFIKTVFTPAAIDIYSRDPAGLSEELVWDIKKALKRTGHPELLRLTDELYECRRDST